MLSSQPQNLGVGSTPSDTHFFIEAHSPNSMHKPHEKQSPGGIFKQVAGLIQLAAADLVSQREGVSHSYLLSILSGHVRHPQFNHTIHEVVAHRRGHRSSAVQLSCGCYPLLHLTYF
jgi:hypothetical protein